MAFVSATIVEVVYLLAAILFIQGLRDMTHPRTAVRGNLLSAGGMLIAVVITMLNFEILDPAVLFGGLLVGGFVGAVLAVRVEMTQMPQLVGLFNGFGGGASALVAGTEVLGGSTAVDVAIAAAASGIIGAVTFFGSLVAAGKLHGVITTAAVRYRGEQIVKAVFFLIAIAAGAYLVLEPAVFADTLQGDMAPSYWLLVAAASILGVLLVIPIGGADMPVVIALLNSYSGLAAAGTGFVLNNTALIIAGTLVGAAGLILTVIMSESMNRSLRNVFFGGVGEAGSGGADVDDFYEGQITETSSEELSILLESADRVVIVPGYGMAVAQAQHAAADLAAALSEDGIEVEFGIHPVAGRMPGHMNVLLAEADVPYDQMKDLEEINPTFAQTDVVIVTGANDVVNPRANEQDAGPLAGMPILEVGDAGSVIVNKRSLSPGFSGEPNPLFTQDNAFMLFGDAKESMQDVVNEYES